MSNIFQRMKRPLTSQMFDAKVGQIACFLVSALVLILGIFKLGRLPLNETELFFGVLLVMVVGLLCVVLGLEGRRRGR